MSIERPCERCGRMFQLNGTTGERPSRFARRRFCGLTCARDFERDQCSERRKSTSKPCQMCGSVAERPPAMAASRKVCSVRCLRAYQAQKKAHRVAGLKCRQCGGPPTTSRMGRFCSRGCYLDSRRGKGKTRKPQMCESCGAAFIAKLNYSGRWARFCSAKCLTAKVSQRPAFLIVQCENCCAVFRRTAAGVKRVRRTYCSRRCQKAHMVGELAPAWRGGSNPNRGAGWIKLAEQMRQRDGYTCQRCTKTQEDNGERLSVDHIVPWRLFADKSEANHPDNLISLCRECHGWKTHVAERQMLSGDMIQFEQYKRSIRMPPLFAAVPR